MKPCPFCGGKAEIIGYDDGLFQVVCRGCDGTQDNFFDSPEEAAESWNNRPIEDELEAENKMLIGGLKAIKKILEEKRPLSIFDAAQIYAECCEALGEKNDA